MAHKLIFIAILGIAFIVMPSVPTGLAIFTILILDAIF